MKVNVHSKSGRRARWYLILLLASLLAPLVIGLVWGAYFDGNAYAALSHARNLAVGRGLSTQVIGEQALLRSPLYALALWLPARLGLSLPQVGLILSALGWSATVAAVYTVGRALKQPVTALVSALLVAFSPVIVSTLGTEVTWTVALAWIGIAATVKKRWSVQTSVLALMLCAHFDWITLATAVLMLIVQWQGIERHHFPAQAGLVLGTIALVGGLLVAKQIAAPLSSLYPSMGEWQRIVQQLLDESEFYWLFLPAMGMGLLAARKALWAGLLWGAVAALSDGPVAEVLAATLGVFLAGLGIGWIIEWVAARAVLRLDRLTLGVSVVLIAGLPLGIAQATSLWQRYQSRPVIRQTLEQQAGEWLRTHSEPAATVLGSMRVGYLADRATTPWDGSGSGRTELANVLNPLTENPPDYCVSFESIGWDHLVKTVWFRELYTPLQKFGSSYDVTAPLTIWGYRRSAFDLGERQPLNVQLPGEVNLVGYKYWPSRIQPGNGVYVTLFLQATQPVTESFRSVVQIFSPNDGLALTRRDMLTPHSVLADWWQSGQVIAERFVLTGTADIPIGAYYLEMSVMSPDEASFVSIYQDEDTSPLDRITLGYVVVPWRGEMDRAKPVGARFGERIELPAFEAPDSLSPETEFDVTLYWKAQRSPEDNYIVFVHLLDGEGQIVTSHDGPPMEGRYPTGAWLPGDVVPDTHHLALDSDIPAGTYQLQVGMYRWPSLERLPVWDGQGVEQPDRTVVLQSVEVR